MVKSMQGGEADGMFLLAIEKTLARAGNEDNLSVGSQSRAGKSCRARSWGSVARSKYRAESG